MTDEKRARKAVERAVRDRRLIRPTMCSQCGATCRPHGHHHNGYSRDHRLDIVWLCSACHGVAHTRPKPERAPRVRLTPDEITARHRAAVRRWKQAQKANPAYRAKMREYEQLRRQRPGYIAWKAAYNERQRLAYAQRRGTNLAERIPYSKSASVAP